ncbi:fatty acid desaturase family protein [Shinella sp. S4-D37]|uniref:fatty acid desaturase family protein n=1 Tax=Shinella sp. S4-D37 TaxID=3161999 RepID=UPI0034653211
MQYRDVPRDYSLVGRDAAEAERLGLASADWYRSTIDRPALKSLMKRTDGPAIRDTVIWFSALGAFGFGGYFFWGSWLCVPFLFVYGVLYGSASDSRWHECGHGTAFKTRWLNDAVYHIACFMILREPSVRKWTHARHHTDTIIVGKDAEISNAKRPAKIVRMLANLLTIPTTFDTIVSLFRHSFGRLNVEEKDFIPEMEHHKVYRVARIWLLIFAGVAALCFVTGSILPAVFVGLPTLYGGWLQLLFAVSQHTGLDEDILDHRLNCRTIYMNPILRFIYWNMNYHLEHHMFPMVPYHALPKLHALIKDDCPTPYSSLLEAFREIIPAVIKQQRDPNYYVVRTLPSRMDPVGHGQYRHGLSAATAE